MKPLLSQATLVRGHEAIRFEYAPDLDTVLVTVFDSAGPGEGNGPLSSDAARALWSKLVNEGWTRFA